MATNELMEYLKGRNVSKFTPHPFYSKEGDFLTYYFKDADFHAERQDDILTLYMSMEDNSFVGFKLKGVVSHLIRTLGDFSLEVHDDDGNLMLAMLFFAGMTLTDNPDALPLYQRLVRDAGKVPIRKQELQPA